MRALKTNYLKTDNMFIKKLSGKNIFWDESGRVEHWDFSRANLSDKSRIEAITQVASICYQNPKALGSESLYNRLLAESIGLPSSSFEFVPVLLRLDDPKHKEIFAQIFCNSIKYGELVENGKYFLTNYRALVYDWEKGKDKKTYTFDIREIYNTEEECKIIKKHFSVFLYDVDFVTRSQMVRHRVNWQELSRRYVSAKKMPFKKYFDSKTSAFAEVHDFFDQALSIYDFLISNKIKPERARRVIPFGTFSKIWGGFQPSQLDNFINLREKGSAQSEIQDVAFAMSELMQVA